MVLADRAGLFVVRIGDKPAELRRKRLDDTDVRDQPAEELGLAYPVVADAGGIDDEITALEAFLERRRMPRGRRPGAGCEDDEQQDEPRAYVASGWAALWPGIAQD